jgi:hypothetical protein
MQGLSESDMRLIGRDQATPIYWRAGRIGFDGFELATLSQFSDADVLADLRNGMLEPGEIVQLAEGFFIVDEDDLGLV